MGASIYGNVGGAARKASKLYGNVGGANRKLKSLWSNVNGVVRKVYSGKIESSLTRFYEYTVDKNGKITNTTNTTNMGLIFHGLDLQREDCPSASLTFSFAAPSALAAGQNMLTFNGTATSSLKHSSISQLIVTYGLTNSTGWQWYNDHSTFVINPSSINQTFTAPYTINEGTICYFTFKVDFDSTGSDYMNQDASFQFPWSGVIWAPTGERIYYL